MYESPIQMFSTALETKLEGEIMTAVQKYDFNVDKEELAKALKYDRDQYEKGYKDGYEAAMKKINDALEAFGYDPR